MIADVKWKHAADRGGDVEEMAKLAAYLGPEKGTIDENLVAAMVPNFGEENLFEPVDAFFALDLEWTLAALRQHSGAFGGESEKSGYNVFTQNPFGIWGGWLMGRGS